MSMPGRARKPLSLVTDGDAAPHWEAAGESEFMSKLSVCQDMWGRDCFTPGQVYGMRQAANALAINKKQIIGAIGVALGGLGPTVQELGTHVEMFEGDGALFEHNSSSPQFLGKFLKLERWVPGKPLLRAKRYHQIISFGSFVVAPDYVALADELANALKSGGYLYVDEIWANDAASAKLLARETVFSDLAIALPDKNSVLGPLAERLDFRSKNEATRLVKCDIRNGLIHAQTVAQRLKQIPEPMRKQRLIALTNELRRAVLLYDALERGAATAMRFVFHKKAEGLS